MDPDVARTVVIALAAVELGLWIVALQVLFRAAREGEVKPAEFAQELAVDDGVGTITGAVEVDGPAEALSSKLVERLVRGGLGMFGPVKIVAADRREVVFEAPRATGSAAGFGVLGFHGGKVRFSPAGSRTRLEYAVETSSARRRVLLGIGWLTLALGMAALGIGIWLEFAYVLPSPHAGLRAQAVQMIQVIHFLWPPFLLAYLARQPSRLLRTQMEVLLHNLPYA
jgi:hypothetical protein